MPSLRFWSEDRSRPPHRPHEETLELVLWLSRAAAGEVIEIDRHGEVGDFDRIPGVNRLAIGRSG